MGSMNSTTAPETPSDDYVPPSGDGVPVIPAAANAAKDDEDDLVVGEQLDTTSTPSPENSPASAGVVPASTPGQAGSTAEPAKGNDTNQSETQDEQDQDETADVGSGPVDPRMAQMAAAAAAAGQRQGGGGSPGITGLIAGAGSTAASLLGGGFKLIGNGIKSVSGHDPSLPKRKTIGERLATRDPVKAEAYYENAGDKVVRERVYRDAFEGMNSSITEARNAERLFQDGVGEMRDVLNNNADLRAMADDAGTSIGDFVHSVKSGTITAAAAKAVVQTLEQSPEFKAAENKIVEAGTTFGQKQDAALTKMRTIETSFPNRANTSIGKQQLSDLADGMKGDDVSKASSKVKKIMDDIEAMADALKQAIRKTLDKVASIFQPK
jgi:hypothetical protein